VYICKEFTDTLYYLSSVKNVMAKISRGVCVAAAPGVPQQHFAAAPGVRTDTQNILTPISYINNDAICPTYYKTF